MAGKMPSRICLSRHLLRRLLCTLLHPGPALAGLCGILCLHQVSTSTCTWCVVDESFCIIVHIEIASSTEHSWLWCKCCVMWGKVRKAVHI